MRTLRIWWHQWRAHVWSKVMLDQALGLAPRALLVPLQDLVDPARMYLNHKQKAEELSRQR